MTVREISRLTGISPATISRMLKNPASVKLSTRTKIEQTLAASGAGHWVNQKFVEKLVLIIPELNNTFFLDFFYGVSDTVFSKNIPLEIYLSHESIAAEHKIFSKIGNYPRTGVLWIPAAGKREAPPFAKNSPLLIAVADRDMEIEDIHLKLLCDNVQAAKKATELLMNEGVKNPIIITGDPNLSNSREREEGFISALSAYGISNTASRVFYADFNSSDSVFPIIEDLLKQNPKIDGILAANHILGLGILKALKKHSVPVPGQIKMVTFDRIPSDELVGTPITEIVFPARDIGIKAAEILLEQDTNYPSQQSYHFSAQIYLPVPNSKTPSGANNTSL